MSEHAKRLRELYKIRSDMALVMGPGTYQDLWRSDAAALVAGAEALERERGTVKVQWDTEGGATKDGLHVWAGPVLNGFVSLVTKGGRTLHCDWHLTLEAAQAAAVAWVDQQEGKDV